MPESRTPTVSELLRFLDTCEVRAVEKATLNGNEAFGYHDESVIVVSRRKHLDTKGDGMVMTGLHELVHEWEERHRKRVREHKVRRWELRLFKDSRLRDAMAVRLLDAWLFGESQP